jgi:hypothetical protein
LVRRRLALYAILTGIVLPTVAAAQEPAAPPSPAADELPPDAHIDIAPTPPEPKVLEAPTDAGPEGPVEAPPPRPHRKGLVLESTLGVLGFGGQFRHVAPPAYWLHAQLGYELTDWLMAFGEGELAFTDSSVAQDPSHSQVFPLYGFGGGARGTVHFTPRVAAFLQAQVDALSANVPHNALTFLGYKKAETLGPSFGARLGVVWYQIDRHLALTAQVGARDALGFARTTGASDLPIMWDGALGLSYTF